MREAVDHGLAWTDRAIILAGQRRYDEALQAFLEALACRPADPEIHANLGHLLLTTGCVTAALQIYEAALERAPGSARAHFNYAAALRAAHRDEAAIVHYRAAIALRPDYLDARNNLANALASLGRLDEAAALLRSAIALAPGQPRLYGNLVHLVHEVYVRLVNAGAVEWQHRAHFFAVCATSMRRILLDRARRKLAVKRAGKQESLDLAKMADLTRIKARDVVALDAALEALAPEALDEADRLQLHFALGKAYADLGRPAEALDQLQRGNALRRQRSGYDETATLALFDRIEAVFTPELVRAGRDAGLASPLPIFVVGMPRSGTSLIEQILASHPDVVGAGELRAIADAVAGLAYPESLPTLVETDGLRGFARDYLARLSGLAPSGQRVVDKMPGNFLNLGLIHLALPGARILHIRRDPIDTCLSCFMTLFAHGHEYSYDLAELGRYWRAYDRLMAHWHRVLPPGTILDVDYAAVVGDFDGEIRRVLAFCGLAWDDACRDFHRTARPVHTASAAQVRRPLYRKPQGLWQAYRGLLGFDAE